MNKLNFNPKDFFSSYEVVCPDEPKVINHTDDRVFKSDDNEVEKSQTMASLETKIAELNLKIEQLTKINSEQEIITNGECQSDLCTGELS